MYLAWNCNATSSNVERILYTLIAGLFSSLYLIYYLVKRVILNKKCKSKLKYNNYQNTSSLVYESKYPENIKLYREKFY